MTDTTPHSTLAAMISCVVAATLTLSSCGGSDSAAAELPTVAPASTTPTNSAEDPSGEAATDHSENSTSETGVASDGPGAVSSDPDEAAAQFARCMTAQGVGGISVNVDENTPAGGTSFSVGSDDSQLPNDTSADLTPEAYEEAIAACKPYSDAAFGNDTRDPALEAELADENLASVQCLRDAGYDVEVDANGTMNHELGPDEDPSEFETATQQCAG